MSKKAQDKYGNIDIPAQSLFPPDREGYLTKQGGSIKTWRKRFFILKGKNLYYFKTPKDLQFTGKIDLEPTSVVKEEQDKKKKSMISITTTKRIFFMYPDKPEDIRSWIEAIQRNVDGLKPQSTPSTPAGPVSLPISSKSDLNKKSPREKLALAKQQVPWLKDEQSKVLEFWQIWSESIPYRNDLMPGMSVDFTVATSADMQKLTWRTSGPQNIFIQKMVDFFWNVGAPESEIDRLNDVGALINPVRIGSWIDMSSKGGMDGGWFFPVDIPVKLAVQAADPGLAIKKFADWAERSGVLSVFAVGRDMGAAPPRQTELRVKLPGSPEVQLNVGIQAFTAFDFPPIPDEVLKIIRGATVHHDGCSLSVITSSEGFVRLGWMVPKPSTDTVLALLPLVGGSKGMPLFEGSLNSSGPSFVEYQYLQKGFGYGVYKEGFDIVFHYDAGEESLE